MHAVLQKAGNAGMFAAMHVRTGQFTSPEHAANVAWRVIRDWLEANLALIAAGMAGIAMLDRFHYLREFVNDPVDDRALDTLTTIIHRGLFNGSGPKKRRVGAARVPRGLFVGHGDRRPPDRGRQYQQRLVGLRAQHLLGHCRVERRRL